MKKKIFFLLILSTISVLLLAQQTRQEIYLDSLYTLAPQLMTEREQVMFESVPVFEMSENQRNRSIPAAVNNADSYYFPYIFYQAALECGQASSLTYLFTYELAVRRNRYVLFDSPYNKYHITSHFAWNFCNGGANTGVSSMETWQVVRTAGSPFTPDWGESYGTGGPSKWLSGYDKYYNALKNRIVDMYAIPTNSAEGIQTLKHWIANHCSDDTQGGMATFYCTYQATNATLPAGTPQGGMAVTTTFTSYVNHSQTIVGYNDSIRYDYNGDGQYTNTLDINNDGIVDVRDWEIGGVIFCNSFGTGWGNGGFAFLPYKKLAETHLENGGIWNACVYIVHVRDEVFPQLTYKATIKHDKRNMLRLTAGFNPDLNATSPSTTIGFNLFNYQGGALFMQGGTTEADKTLELGLDVTPLLNQMSPNTPYKFFLGVTESDASGTGTGTIVNFSVMDYTGTTVNEIPCVTTNLPIANNTTTYLSTQHSVNFTKPVIQTESVTTNAFEEFSKQLQATQGKPPYRWEFTKEYLLDEFTAPYPTNSGAAVTLSNTDNGYATIPLSFSFPCFEKNYNQIVVFADGYIAFRYDTYNWPFLKDPESQLRTSRFIAPFRADLVVTSVMKESDAHSIIITFSANIKSQPANSVKFTVKLYDTGVIEYYYGNMTYTGSNFISVLSRGDDNVFQTTPISKTNGSNCSNRNFRFTPPAKIEGISLSHIGELKGRIEQSMVNIPISITCCDNNEVKTTKVLSFSSLYNSVLIITNIAVNSNGNTTISAGDTVSLSITVKNVDEMGFEGCNLKFSIFDDYITLLDSTEYFGYIAGGNEYTLNNCIKFVVEHSTPNNYVAEFNTLISNTSNINSEGTRSFIIQGREVEVINYTLVDGNNGVLDANENVSLTFNAKNTGVTNIQNLRFELRFMEPEITVTSQSIQISSLAKDEIAPIPFQVLVNSSFVSGTSVDALVDIYVNNNLFKTEIVSIIGESNCNGFESGFPSYFTFSDTAWIISTSVYANGFQAAASGNITHYQQTSMNIQKTIVNEGTVSFKRKVSSEANYDFLRFYIDGVQQAQWSGSIDWAEMTYPITAGNHLFTWRYSKDVSVNTGSDKAYIDDICFPSENTAIPTIAVNPESIYVEVPLGTTLDSTFTITSTTPIYALFTNQIIDSLGFSVNWCTPNYPNGIVNGLQTKTVTLKFNSRNKNIGQIYTAILATSVLEGNTITTPISMKIVSEVGIEDYTIQNGYLVYPNPTNNEIQIATKEGDLLIREVQLYDMNGKNILSQKVMDHATKLELGSLSSGIYLVKIINENNNIQHIKVIKK